MSISGQNAILNQYVPTFCVKGLVNKDVLVYDENIKAFKNAPLWTAQGVSTFTELLDTPDSYVSQENKLVAVNATGTGLIFIDSSGGGGISKVEDDPDPHLGGDLNTNGYEIIMPNQSPTQRGIKFSDGNDPSNSNNLQGVIYTSPDSGDFLIKGYSLNLRLSSFQNTYVEGDDVTIQNNTFPRSDGQAGQVLSTDGNGQLSFVTVSGGIPDRIVDAANPLNLVKAEADDITIDSTGFIGLTSGQDSDIEFQAGNGAGWIDFYGGDGIIGGNTQGSGFGFYAGSNESSGNDDSGYFEIYGGLAFNDGDGGYVDIYAGDTAGSGTGGSVTVSGGESFDTGTGGSVFIVAGSSSTGPSGNVVLSSGNSNITILVDDANVTIQHDSGGSTSYTMPVNRGIAGQVLTTDGVGGTSFTDPISAVDSIFGRTGVVVADSTDYGSFYATLNQGETADTAIQPGDNISELTNDTGYITLADVPVDAVTSVDGRTGVVTLSDLYATFAQGETADTAIQPGDNISELTNDANYTVVGDDISNFVNNANYIASGDVLLGGTW